MNENTKRIVAELVLLYGIDLDVVKEAMYTAKHEGPVIMVNRRSGLLSYVDGEYTLEEFS